MKKRTKNLIFVMELCLRDRNYYFFQIVDMFVLDFEGLLHFLNLRWIDHSKYDLKNLGVGMKLLIFVALSLLLVEKAF